MQNTFRKTFLKVNIYNLEDKYSLNEYLRVFIFKGNFFRKRLKAFGMK